MRYWKESSKGEGGECNQSTKARKVIAVSKTRWEKVVEGCTPRWGGARELGSFALSGQHPAPLQLRGRPVSHTHTNACPGAHSRAAGTHSGAADKLPPPPIGPRHGVRHLAAQVCCFHACRVALEGGGDESDVAGPLQRQRAGRGDGHLPRPLGTAGSEGRQAERSAQRVSTSASTSSP